MRRREFLATAAATMSGGGQPHVVGAGTDAGEGQAVHPRSHRDHDAELSAHPEGARRSGQPRTDAGAVRHRRDDRGQVRRPQGGVPALSHRLDRTVVPERASQPAGEGQVESDSDQSGVQRPEHVRAAPPRPVDGDRPHEGMGRSRGSHGRTAGHGEPGGAGRRGFGHADAREQGLRHSCSQGDGGLRPVQGHHRFGRDARRGRRRPRSRKRSGRRGAGRRSAGRGRCRTGFCRTGCRLPLLPPHRRHRPLPRCHPRKSGRCSSKS